MGCPCASSKRTSGLSASRYAAASVAWSNVCKSVLKRNRDDQTGERRACSNLSKDAMRNLLFSGLAVSVIGNRQCALCGGEAQVDPEEWRQCAGLGMVLTAYGIPRAGSTRLRRLAHSLPGLALEESGVIRK